MFRTSCLALAALVLLTAPPLRSGDAPKPVRVLFIGNSYTFVNDLPRMLAALARAGGQRPVVHDRETPGGCTLEKHWRDGKAAQKIAAGKWDYVVLQEQSSRPLVDRPRMF